MAAIYRAEQGLFVHEFFVRRPAAKTLIDFKHAQLARLAAHLESLADASVPIDSLDTRWLCSYTEAAVMYCRNLCEEVREVAKQTG